jgi:hypothetical protein
MKVFNTALHAFSVGAAGAFACSALICLLAAVFVWFGLKKTGRTVSSFSLITQRFLGHCPHVESADRQQEIWNRAIVRTGTSRPLSAKCGLAGLQLHRVVHRIAALLATRDFPRSRAGTGLRLHSRSLWGSRMGVTFLAPGLRFFHQSQFQGRQKCISRHLVRTLRTDRHSPVSILLPPVRCAAPPAVRRKLATPRLTSRVR